MDEKETGMPDFVKYYQQKIDQLKQTITTLYRDNNRGEFADTPEKKLFSQHSNILAILTGTVEGEDARKLMDKVLNDKELTKVTIFFRHFENGKWKVEIGLPKLLSGYLLWNAGRYELKPGDNSFIL